MKYIKVATGAIIVLAIVAAFLAPIGPLPGFRIGGTATPVPEAWGDTRDIHEIRLQVPGTLPRTVIIWVIQYEGELYVVGNSSSGWVQMLGEGGPVKMRMQDNTYDLKAMPVTSGWAPILNDYMDKYRSDYPDIVNGFPDPEAAQGQFSVYQLGRS